MNDKNAIKDHVLKYADIYSRDILDPGRHMQLVQNIETYAEAANIPAHFIYTGLSKYCSQAEIDWVTKLRKRTNGDSLELSLAYTGITPLVEDRMMALAGCCLRNFIDARVMTVQTVIDALKNNRMSSPTVLLIPNFFLKKDAGGDLPSWQVSSLLGLLYDRFAKHLPTVLYIQSLASLGTAYGPSFKSHVEAHFTVLDNEQGGTKCHQ